MEQTIDKDNWTLVTTQLPNRDQTLQRNTAALQRRIDRLQPQSNRYSWLRVLIFLLGLALSALLLFTLGGWFFGGGLLLTFLVFGVVVYRHNQLERALQETATLQAIKRAQLARIHLDWGTIPPTRQTQPRYEHPFEADLDLVGPRSLHRLLDSTVTQEASQRLRDWLTATPPTEQELLHRQTLVRELIPRSHFRNKLQLYGELLLGGREPWRAEHLLTWLQPHGATHTLLRWVIGLGALALINALLFLLNYYNFLPPWWRLTFGLYALLYFWQGRTLSHTFEEAKTLEEDLSRLAGVFRHLERYGYQGAPTLQALCLPLRTGEHRPSHYLQRISRIVAATGIQGNPVLAILLNGLLPWGIFFAWRLAEWKEAVATDLPRWLEVWYELETVSALAGYGWLNPESTFPTFHTNEAVDKPAPVFVGHGIGHPLLPNERKVRNDFTVNHLGEVAILTGSNMAGKSTLLKALGVNLALAYAGGVVDVQAMQTMRFRLFTCIKVSDSVTDGISYFYAEVQRLRALLDELSSADDLPLFFAVDEIFRGTNNRERLIGSRAYIRALAGQRGIGLISTHDLELVRLEDEVTGVTNYHFRDEIVDGRMAFDYRLRRGPSPTTNALRIMALEGLPVE
jgi:ABC-type multidrug transport system fused ATPase/permease subunit